MQNKHESSMLKRLRRSAFLIALIPSLCAFGTAIVILLFVEDSVEEVEPSEVAMLVALLLGTPFIILAFLSWYLSKIAILFALVVMGFYLYGAINPPDAGIWFHYPMAFFFLICAILNICVWRTKRRLA